MQTHARKMLVIVAEAALEKQLVADSKRLGAHGYTIVDVRGGGWHGTREASWEGDRSIEMQVVCEETTAKSIAQHVLNTYSQHYSIAVFITDALVFRAEKF